MPGHRHGITWRVIFTRRMAIFVFLGFSSGLPLFVLLNLVQAWLKTEGVTLSKIALFALIQFPYTWKFLWAPLLDRYTLARAGRRRGWMIVMHVAVLLSICAFGWFDPREHLSAIAMLAALLAFFSASLDIVIDAFRREYLSDPELGLGTAIHVNAYKIAGFVPGGLSLILADHLPWSLVFPITAAFMLPGLVVVLFLHEPVLRAAPPRTLRDAVVLPFKEFVERDGWRQALLILAFIFVYKLGDSLSTSLSTSFYLDLGFTKTQIGLVAKSVGLWSSVVGGLVGGVWLVTLGINRGLWVFGALQLLSILAFAWLAHQGADPVALAMAIGVEAFASVGLGTAAFTAYIARTTDVRFTATQFALFTSLASVPRTFANAGAGFAVQYLGWTDFFFVCAVLGIPGMLLLPWVAPWRAPAAAKLG